MNASESRREQSGIIRRHFRDIKRREQFFEVPLCLILSRQSAESVSEVSETDPGESTGNTGVMTNLWCGNEAPAGCHYPAVAPAHD